MLPRVRKRKSRVGEEGRRRRRPRGRDSMTDKSGLEGGEERKIRHRREEESRNGGQRGGGGEERKRVKRQPHPPRCYITLFGSGLSKFISGLER